MTDDQKISIDKALLKGLGWEDLCVFERALFERTPRHMLRGAFLQRAQELSSNREQREDSTKSEASGKTASDFVRSARDRMQASGSG